MACCAFAVFLLMQLLIPFRRLYALVSGSAPDGRATPNPAVAWSPYASPQEVTGPDTAPAMPALPPMNLKRSLAWVVALELGLAAAALAGVAYFGPADAATPDARSEWALSSLHGTICGRDGIPEAQQTASISDLRSTSQ
jgi:hypothetical protein